MRKIKRMLKDEYKPEYLRVHLIVNVGGTEHPRCLFCLFLEAKDIENLVFTPPPYCLFKIRNNNSRRLPGLWAGAELILGNS